MGNPVIGNAVIGIAVIGTAVIGTAVIGTPSFWNAVREPMSPELCGRNPVNGRVRNPVRESRSSGTP
jgi:hypothetical protein